MSGYLLYAVVGNVSIKRISSSTVLHARVSECAGAFSLRRGEGYRWACDDTQIYKFRAARKGLGGEGK